MSFDVLNYPIVYAAPRWLTTMTAWSEHIPFAMFIVNVHSPASLVELGSYAGDSYCAFCQAVNDLKLPTRCMAVDTWKGDKHTGDYPEHIFASLNQYNQTNFSNFSRLNRTDFDSAAREVPDGSIDLLHIDGLHTYEAVRHDFETWLPKMSDRGLILFHDTAVRAGDFGVYKLFAEVSAGRLAFEFEHCAGLGVLAVGKNLPEPTRAFLEAAQAEPVRYRTLFGALGSRWGLLTDRGRLLQKWQECLFHLREWRKQNKLPVQNEGDDPGLFMKNPQKATQVFWNEISSLVQENANLSQALTAERAGKTK